MNKKSLLILIAAAAILGGLAYMKSDKATSQRSTHSGLSGKKLFPELTGDNANSITSIEFRSAEAEIRLAKKGDNWVASSLHDYPIDFAQVKAFIASVYNQKIGQVLNANEAQRRELQLMAPEKAAEADRADAGTRVTLKTGDTVVGTILIGGTFSSAQATQTPYGPMPGGGGQYIQTEKGDVVLVAGSFSEAQRKNLDWINAELLRVPQGEVKAVTVSGPDHTTVTINKNAETKSFTLDALPEGKELVDAEVNGLAGALSYLSIAGVADPAKSDKELGFDTSITYISTHNNGLTHTVQIGGQDTESEGRLIRVKLSYIAPAASIAKPAADANDEAKKAYDAQIARLKATEERLAKEADDFNAQHGKWTYTIASYKADALLKKHDALYKDPDPKEEAEPAAVAPKTAP